MAHVTVISDEVRTTDATVVGDRVLLEPAELPSALGWTLKPEGLCRDDVCVPVRRREDLFDGELVDLAAVAAALGRPAVVDPGAAVAAVALPAEQRRAAIAGRSAPQFTLPDLDGTPRSLDEWAGRKKLLVAFASW